jgi:putative ABC transport system ATP-binding protein
MNIAMRSVYKEYALGRTTVEALKDVHLEIDQGEFVALMGPSGSGKSTLLNLMGALDTPTRGEILVGGRAVNELKDEELARIRRERIGFIFQSFNLIPVLSVFGNVEMPLILRNTPKNVRREKVDAMLERVGLADRAHHKTEELSGGQRQRVAIARALVTEPSIILSDEPTANLDSTTGQEILNLMRHLNDERKVTLVFATHDQNIVSYARRVVRIRDGMVAEEKIPV